MIVFNLACANEHLFEGWFASADDFEAQCARALVRCPVCDDTHVERRLSAPRLNLGATAGHAEAHANAPAAGALQKAWLAAMRQLVESTEDVGARFPEEARRIHYGDVAERGIRGVATPDEARALADEGIEVARIALPASLKEPLQ